MTKIPVRYVMLLSHPWLLSRWLSPVWEDSAFWDKARQPAVADHLDDGQAGQGRGSLTVLLGSLGGELSLETLGGRSLVNLPCEGGISTTLHHIETLLNTGNSHTLSGQVSGKLSGNLIGNLSGNLTGKVVGNMTGDMGILTLALCWHDTPLQVLGEWARRVPFLYIIDWAMPERNLDYLCHGMPRILALLSGKQAQQRFREYMRHGPEGLVEQFNTSQGEVFLKRLQHKKYRWGSIIALGYAVEYVRPEA